MAVDVDVPFIKSVYSFVHFSHNTFELNTAKTFKLFRLSHAFVNISFTFYDFSLKQKTCREQATQSVFCFIPRGKSAWSSRLFSVMFGGCIPVILNDEYELPFEHFLSTSQFAIKWPMRVVDDTLIDYLKSIPDAKRNFLQETGQHVMCWYFWPASKMTGEWMYKKKLREICPDYRKRSAFHAVFLNSFLNFLHRFSNDESFSKKFEYRFFIN